MTINDVLLRHRPECRIPLLENLRAREDWATSWPQHCRACEGWGLQDDGDSSVGLVGTAPCPSCAERGTCPRCGTRYAFLHLSQISLEGVPMFIDIEPRERRQFVEWRIEYLLGNIADHVTTEFVTESINLLAEQILDRIVTAHDGSGGCRACGFDYGEEDSMPPPFECACGEIEFEHPRDVSPVRRGTATCPKCRRENIATVDGMFAPHDRDGEPCAGAIEFHIFRGIISEVYVVRDPGRVATDPIAVALSRGTFTTPSPLHAVAEMLHSVKPDYPPLDILSVLRFKETREGEWIVDARLWLETLQVKYAEIALAEEATRERRPFVEPAVMQVKGRTDVEEGGTIW